MVQENYMTKTGTRMLRMLNLFGEAFRPTNLGHKSQM